MCFGGTCQSSPDCFIGATPVLMADGSERAIEEIEVGDVVLGSNGQPNVVLDVLRLALGARRLHALNDDNYFVTASHPLLTADGWKSVAPRRTANKQRGAITTTPLRVGDRLVVADASSSSSNVRTATALQHVALTSLRSRAADPALRIYNLTVDGDQTYFANGVVAHIK
jgi:hypothetical protein